MRPIKLIFHAGAGKTGTSSIQASLREAIPQLSQHGIWYLGLVLEHAPVRSFDWQEFGQTPKLHSLSDKVGSEQIHTVLSRTLDLARRQGVHTLIWSSESFFDRPNKAIAALNKLEPRDVDVQIVIYLRRHDRWAQSAYLQWGIKHKTMGGAVRPFSAWVERRAATFLPHVEKFLAAFPGQVSLRNFDHAGNVVTDFLHLCSIPNLIDSEQRENITADDGEIYLRAVFNDMVIGPALPNMFNRSVGRDIRGYCAPNARLAELFDIDAVDARTWKTIEEDAKFVNEFLARSAQPLLPDQVGPETASFPVADVDRLLLAASSLLMDHANRIQAANTYLSNKM